MAPTSLCCVSSHTRGWPWWEWLLWQLINQADWTTVITLSSSNVDVSIFEWNVLNESIIRCFIWNRTCPVVAPIINITYNSICISRRGILANTCSRQEYFKCWNSIFNFLKAKMCMKIRLFDQNLNVKACKMDFITYWGCGETSRSIAVKDSRLRLS
jgi:hypothetical protein